jgi:hypothetical protein
MVRIVGEKYEDTMAKMEAMEADREFDINSARDDERDLIADYITLEAERLEEADEGDLAFNFASAKILRDHADAILNMTHLGNVQPIKKK